ncbi:MAG: hypothetical protein Unbinned92contig1003_49 [Prokaryotic dsDNA virus sp.]|nr:MAG: hypothetical protein Unbinned92contig1003_49 [Prokaryotic dsDNA virus sp.]|tara:strand:+ start:1767 stop:2327 length:561 start_codon:yes stop_codon:yes gene_type:complete
MAVLFVSEDTIKKSTTINGNVDVELLLPYIKVAQDIHIHQLLGTDLYDKLQNDVATSSLAGVYKTLIDEYVQPVLIHYSLYECLPFLSYKIMNKDIVRKISETSSAATLDDIKYLRNIVKDTAEYYSERLVDYIRDNTESYPEYSSNTGSDLPPTKETYFSGIVMDRDMQRNRITLRDFLESSYDL